MRFASSTLRAPAAYITYSEALRALAKVTRFEKYSASHVLPIFWRDGLKADNKLGMEIKVATVAVILTLIASLIILLMNLNQRHLETPTRDYVPANNTAIVVPDVTDRSFVTSSPLRHRQYDESGLPQSEPVVYSATEGGTSQRQTVVPPAVNVTTNAVVLETRLVTERLVRPAVRSHGSLFVSFISHKKLEQSQESGFQEYPTHTVIAESNMVPRGVPLFSSSVVSFAFPPLVLCRLEATEFTIPRDHFSIVNEHSPPDAVGDSNSYDRGDTEQTLAAASGGAKPASGTPGTALPLGFGSDCSLRGWRNALLSLACSSKSSSQTSTCASSTPVYISEGRIRKRARGYTIASSQGGDDVTIAFSVTLTFALVLLAAGYACQKPLPDVDKVWKYLAGSSDRTEVREQLRRQPRDPHRVTYLRDPSMPPCYPPRFISQPAAKVCKAAALSTVQEADSYSSLSDKLEQHASATSVAHKQEEEPRAMLQRRTSKGRQLPRPSGFRWYCGHRIFHGMAPSLRPVLSLRWRGLPQLESPDDSLVRDLKRRRCLEARFGNSQCDAMATSHAMPGELLPGLGAAAVCHADEGTPAEGAPHKTATVVKKAHGDAEPLIATIFFYR
ncbi:hypothetical protein HPB50_003685 [Hyalomma asiaticum]|uniref:Uncharacterized protein n=1 Tax=Hyalomma asiaticum TaxID=266040 RepID=A0ACB7SRD3_HYAAI|nr:hypothetical protein HPB50_003685 [Hyalomma asiaticum]